MTYKVMVQWYSAVQGGRQQPPELGRYFATTYLINERHERSMWSIHLELPQSIEAGELGFLFDTYPQVIKVGDLLPILEGAREVGMMLVVDIIR